MNSKLRLNFGIQTIVRVGSAKSLYSTIRFHLKRIHTSFYGRIRLYTCDHSIFTVWRNYDAFVSFAVVTIVFYMYLFNLYLNLLIYVCDWWNKAFQSNPIQSKVSFRKLDGIERRLVAHTCRPLLEFPTTYEDFGQFKGELHKTLQSGYWNMDKFDKYKVTSKGYGHSDSVFLLMLRFILKIFKHYWVLFSETS